MSSLSDYNDLLAEIQAIIPENGWTPAIPVDGLFRRLKNLFNRRLADPIQIGGSINWRLTDLLQIGEASTGD